MIRRFVAVTATVTAIVCVAAPGARQAQQPTPVFRSRVDVVHFDVSVLDKARRPVRGLTAADFTVQEDGKPQPIVAFSAVDVPPSAPLPTAKWMREISPDVRTNEPEDNPEGRLFVLLLDDALLPADPAALNNARKIAHGVLDRLSPIDQVAVVFSLASRNAQDFTTDRKKLVTAIDSLRPGTATHVLGWDMTVAKDPRSPGVLVPAVDGDAGLRLGSLRTLELVANTLIAAPQRRKALIFVSPGITVDLESDARPVQARSTDPGTTIREANHQLAREMPDVFRRMQSANVTIYSIDPFGQGGLENYIMDAALRLRSLQVAASPPTGFYNWLDPSGPPRPGDLARHAATIDTDFLMASATNTGGRAIVNTNDFESGLDGIFAENTSYYLIGYARPAKNEPGSQHRVTVKVNRPDVTTRTRSGYATDADDAAARKEPITSALSKAASGPVAAGALPLQISVAPVALPAPTTGKDNAAVTIVLGLRQPQVTTRTPQTIELRASMFTPDGQRIGAPLRQTATFALVPGPGDVLRYELLTHVAVAPGRYSIRVAAHRATDDVSGSVYTDVEVPDFSKAPLSMSGVWLESLGAPSAVPRDAFVSLIPVVPTAGREFTASDRVTAFFRVYQGGDAPIAPVPVTVRIVNARDETLANATGTIGVERFAATTRAADHRFVMPLNALPPGRYLVSFELTLGQATARRDVVFTVR